MAKIKITLKEICEKINNRESFENLELSVEKQGSLIDLQSTKNIYSDVIIAKTREIYFSYNPNSSILNIKIPDSLDLDIKTHDKTVGYSSVTGLLSLYKTGSHGGLDRTDIQNTEEADLSWQYNTNFQQMEEK